MKPAHKTKAMNKQNIQQIIRELFRQYYNANEGQSFHLTEGALMSDEGTAHAQDVAKGYWAERNEDEIERDEKAGVTEIDYVEWVIAELSELTPATEATQFQTWAAEINKDWTAGYKATATDESLQVTFNSEEVARIDHNNGRYTVTGTEKEAVEQLEYMVAR
jgi:hypothetical protein